MMYFLTGLDYGKQPTGYIVLLLMMCSAISCSPAVFQQIESCCRTRQSLENDGTGPALFFLIGKNSEPKK